MTILASAQARAASIFAGLTFRLVLLAALAAVLFNSYADIRIVIPILPDIRFEGLKPFGERMRQERDALAKAQEQAGKDQRDVIDREQDRLDTAAKGSEYEKPLIDTAVRAAVAEYVRTHRVQPGASCPSSSPGPAAEGDAAGVVEGMPRASGILVSEPDLQKLSDAAGYAVACHNWALEISGAD